MRTAGEIREARRFSYEGSRPEVQALVPAGTRRLLDAGCASGHVTAPFARRGGGTAEVVGVEREDAYATAAGERLDRVVHADLAELVDRPDLAGELGRFDCLVAADVLEHLVDPWHVLRHLTGLVDPGGTVVVSLPNVRHWTSFWNLARHGTWPRHDEGIFDATHLRWFTAGDAVALLAQAGVAVGRIERRMRVRTVPGRLAPVAERLLEGLPGLRDLATFQHVLVGRREPAGQATRSA